MMESYYEKRFDNLNMHKNNSELNCSVTEYNNALDYGKPYIALV